MGADDNEIGTARGVDQLVGRVTLHDVAFDGIIDVAGGGDGVIEHLRFVGPELVVGIWRRLSRHPDVGDVPHVERLDLRAAQPAFLGGPSERLDRAVRAVDSDDDAVESGHGDLPVSASPRRVVVRRCRPGRRGRCGRTHSG
jgi:hypothetical protein